MFVGERMTHPVISVHPELPIQEALNMMRLEHVRRLIVVGTRGELLGIVTKNDLLNASPSEVSSLSVWEMNYLLSKITVERVMVRNVITISENTPLEEAARIMADNKIGSLPVVKNGQVVGMITETDLFKVFLEMLGARESGVRLTVLLKDVPGQLNALTSAITSMGGNIIALGTFLGESTENRIVTMKVSGVSLEKLRETLTSLVQRITDIRETVAA
ncbi:MAG: CBS and ACT domain-containing protein [Anaerolineaceae bacterium]|nr:CBS and ACT domain-containing protein [Anaerolineaceae bacterium]